MFESRFQIIDVGQVAGSHRGIRQEIRPIANGRIRRKLSGRAYSTARPQFRQLQTTVYFDDMRPPAFAGLWPGDIVTIHCAVELPQPQRVGTAPIRPVVPGTLVYIDAAGNEVPQAEASHFNFCPILTGIVEPWSITDDEWNAAAQSDISIVELQP
jgi:hypothetical protein